MDSEGWFYAFLVGFATIVLVGVGCFAASNAKITSTEVQQVKVVAINGERIAFESSTTRFNLYNDGGASPKVGATVTLQINKHKHSDPDYIVKGYPNISAEKPDDDDMAPIFFMPTS